MQNLLRHATERNIVISRNGSRSKMSQGEVRAFPAAKAPQDEMKISEYGGETYMPMNPLLTYHGSRNRNQRPTTQGGAREHQLSVENLAKHIFAPLPRCAQKQTQKNRMQLRRSILDAFHQIQSGKQASSIDSERKKSAGGSRHQSRQVVRTEVSKAYQHQQNNRQQQPFGNGAVPFYNQRHA